MLQFVGGVIMMELTVAGLLFLRFWSRTRDRLFLMFAIAFWTLASNRLLMAVLTHREAIPDEHCTPFYVVRLAAFVLILIAILDKNRPRNREAIEPSAAP